MSSRNIPKLGRKVIFDGIIVPVVFPNVHIALVFVLGVPFYNFGLCVIFRGHFFSIKGSYLQRETPQTRRPLPKVRGQRPSFLNSLFTLAEVCPLWFDEKNIPPFRDLTITRLFVYNTSTLPDMKRVATRYFVLKLQKTPLFPGTVVVYWAEDVYYQSCNRV